jgi:hypothetical protein
VTQITHSGAADHGSLRLVRRRLAARSCGMTTLQANKRNALKNILFLTDFSESLNDQAIAVQLIVTVKFRLEQ